MENRLVVRPLLVLLQVLRLSEKSPIVQLALVQRPLTTQDFLLLVQVVATGFLKSWSLESFAGGLVSAWKACFGKAGEVLLETWGSVSW